MELLTDISIVLNTLKKIRFLISDEKALQTEIEKSLNGSGVDFVREFYFDNSKDHIDFMIADTIGMEIKIKGSRKKIYEQCVRYCNHGRITSFILVTNRSMGFPKEINGVPCYVLNLSKAWL